MIIHIEYKEKEILPDNEPKTVYNCTAMIRNSTAMVTKV